MEAMETESKALDLVREVTMGAAFDRRDPDPSQNYGIHGVDLRMVLRGPHGATQFVVYTNWHLPHVTEESLRKVRDRLDARALFCPLPADVGYHSKVPQWEGQSPMDGECEYTGGVCYYDGSGLQAEEVFSILLHEGSDGVWRELEKRYRDLFCGEATDA